MKIAVEGCCHGELDKIYETIAFLEKEEDIKVDLLLMCGDFQAVRNRADLQAMAVPPKYQRMNTFYKYYSGEKKAPILTVFIGGNHEASNYLQELPYGGWVAPNIYYLGYAGIVQFGGLRIGGLSGIYKSRDYNKGHYEHPPYSEDTKRSCYHVRSLEVFRLKQIKKKVDLFLSHDWPRGIYDYGNAQALLRKKTFFKEEVESGTLGSAAAEDILFKLKPDYWFSAHLHVKFAALVEHQGEEGQKKTTKFLALDKCLPRRKFLQVLDVPHDSSKALQLELDPEWLAILKSTNHLLNLSKSSHYMPGPGSQDRWDFSVTEADLKSLEEDFAGMFKVPSNFEQTVSPYDVAQDRVNKCKVSPPQICINPQTSLLCEMLGLTDPFAVFSGKQQPLNLSFVIPDLAEDEGNDSLDVDDEGVDDSDFIDTSMDLTVNTTFDSTINPDEISLDDIENEDGNTDEGPGARINIPAPTQMLYTPTSTSVSEIPPGVTTTPPASVSEIPPGVTTTPPAITDQLTYDRKLSNPDEISFDVSSTDRTDASFLSPLAQRLEASDIGAESSGSSGSPVKRSSESGSLNLSCDSTVDETPMGETSAPRPKKFKRRNQSIYQSQDEEDM